MVYEVKDKVVLITGAASGIGAASVRLLLEEGAKHIAILDVDEADGTALQDELNSKYGANKVKFYTGDVTNDDQMYGVYKSVVDEQGYIDVVINNAGIMNDSMHMYKKEIEINMTALVTSTLKALELMRKDEGGKGGCILNISSVAGLTQMSYMPIYWATKSAVIQFSNCIGLEEYYKRTGVRVVAVCYGATATRLGSKLGTFDKDYNSNLRELFSFFPKQKYVVC